MDQKVTKSATKNEIWEAYKELVQLAEQKENEVPQKQQQIHQEKEVIKTATALSSDKIIKSIAELKSSYTSSLDKIEESLTSEYKKLETLQKAIALEQKNIEELYGIKTNAHSLTILIQLYNNKKAEFEKDAILQKANFQQEITYLRNDWDKEKIAFEKTQKVEKAELEKIHIREEEEYKYNLSIIRKKELNDWNEKQLLLEKQHLEKQQEFDKQIIERENAITSSEQELKELREKSLNFPSEIEKVIKQTEKSISEKLNMSYEFEKQLNAKQTESDIKIKDQIILSQQEKIKELETAIKDINSKSQVAEASVKEIAIKAIENSNKVKFIESNRKNEEH